MSTENLQTIIGRAMTEAEFRDLLFKDPATAIAGYDLTEEESQALKEIQSGNFETAAQELEERLSRISLGGHGGHGRKRIKLSI